jgi:predicted nucleic acid-binding protein
LIPGAVLEELRVEENLPGSQGVRDAIKAGWIRIETVKQNPLVRAMQRDLDDDPSIASIFEEIEQK